MLIFSGSSTFIATTFFVLTPHLLVCSTNQVIRTVATNIVHEVAVHNFTENEVHGLFDWAAVSLTTANI